MTLSKVQKNLVIFIVTFGAFLASLGQSLLTSSVPVISVTFRVSEVMGEWLTTSYILVLGIVSALTAFLINRIPTKKLFSASMILFLFGCIISLISPNFYILLGSRIIQAIGAGVLLPLAQVVVIHLFPREQHGRAFSVIGIIVAFAPAIGPTLAGLLIDNFGWKSIFVLLMILSALTLILGIMFLVNVGENFSDKLDVLSVFLYGIGFSTIMLGVTKLSESNTNLFFSILPCLVGVLSLAYFVFRSLKLEHPLLKLQLFKNKEFSFPFILIVICYLASMSGVIQLPLYVQTARGISATVSGMVMLPAAIITFIATPIGGKLLDSRGSRFVAILGMTFLLIGSIPFCFFGNNTPLFIVASSYAIRNFGMTLALNPLTAYCVGGLKGADISHGNAIIASMRQMFGTLGSTALVSIASIASTSNKIDVFGLNISFLIQTVLFIVGLILAILCVKSTSTQK